MFNTPLSESESSVSDDFGSAQEDEEGEYDDESEEGDEIDEYCIYNTPILSIISQIDKAIGCKYN